MTLEEVRQILTLFSPDLPWGPDQFESAINHAQLKYFRQLYDQGDERRQHKIVAGEGIIPPLYFTNGRADIPSDYFRWIGAYHFVGGRKRRVRILDDKAYNEVNDSDIEEPTYTYAIANFQDGFVRVSPTSVKAIVLAYMSLPRSVEYGWTDVNGIMEYDPAISTELDWDDYDIVAIIQIVLSDLGIVVSREEIERKRK